MSASVGSNTEWSPIKFPVGYHRIHADLSLNYQMNRFSTASPDMIAEMRAVAPGIRDYPGHVRVFLHLSEQALQKG